MDYWQVGVQPLEGTTAVGEAVRRCRHVLAQTEVNRTTLSAEMYHALGHLLAREGTFEEALKLFEQRKDVVSAAGARASIAAPVGLAPHHLHYRGHRGACRKPPVVPHDRPPTDGIHRTGGARCR